MIAPEATFSVRIGAGHPAAGLRPGVVVSTVLRLGALRLTSYIHTGRLWSLQGPEVAFLDGVPVGQLIHCADSRFLGGRPRCRVRFEGAL